MRLVACFDLAELELACDGAGFAGSDGSEGVAFYTTAAGSRTGSGANETFFLIPIAPLFVDYRRIASGAKVTLYAKCGEGMGDTFGPDYEALNVLESKSLMASATRPFLCIWIFRLRFSTSFMRSSNCCS